MPSMYKLWLGLLIVSGAIALWFSGIATVQVWQYARLNAQTPATVLSWGVRDLSSSRYAIEADYRYEVKGTSHRGKTVFKHPQFLNRYAAENHAKTMEGKRWHAWYVERNPAHSSLERKFPQKECLHALLTVGVFAYFYFSRSMLTKLMV